MDYIIPFLTSFSLSIILTLIVKKLAIFFNIIDKPGERKIHSKNTPLLGGVAVFLSFFIVLFLFSDRFLAGNLNMHHLIGFFIGAAIIIFGGVLDDKYNLPAKIQIIFPLLAILAVILGGVEIEKITSPFGGFFELKKLIWLGPALVFVWLLGMMYTTKLLDGVDGLVSGIGVIGSLIIFLFTLTTRYYQPDIALAALILAGAGAGFLIFNFHPAKIFLGEGGSLFFGYVLGVLAVISGGKIAIALLIMGLPILDVIWTISRRIINRHNPFNFSDKKHLHHRLLNLGLSQSQTVAFFYIFSFAFGSSGLFLQSRGKLFALILLVFLMLLIVYYLYYLDQKKVLKKPSLLLHICCAPCGSYVSREVLLPKYRLTWFFYNPNLVSLEEYNKRLASVKLMADKLAIKLIVVPYDNRDWLQKVKGRENDKEKGARCIICCLDRLQKTVALAKKDGYDFFGTTLTVSPYKDKTAIDKLSAGLASQYKIAYITEDLTANNNFKKSQDLAKEYNLYRQKFCACKYSIKK